MTPVNTAEKDWGLLDPILLLFPFLLHCALRGEK